MATVHLRIGDLVWGKLGRYPPWPGKIVSPPKDLKKPSGKKCFFVKFFGTEDHAWIKVEQLKPYHPHKEDMIKVNKGKRFQQAVDAVEEFLKKARGREQASHNSADENNKSNSDDKTKSSSAEARGRKNSTSTLKSSQAGESDNLSPKKRGRPPKDEKVVLGPSGVLQGIRPGKCYVEMSTVDPDTVTELSQVITSRGGRFLEAPVSGSQQLSNDGMLVILAAGDRSLYEDCSSCFQAMGKTSFFLGEVGNAAKMMLILNMVHGSFMATIAEGLTLAQVTGQSQTTFLDILSHGQMASTFLDQKCQRHQEQHLEVMREEEFQWLLREEVHAVLKQLQDILKIQDARNHMNQALQLLSSRDESYRFKTGAEVDKLMDAVMLQLSRARNRLTTPASMTLPEVASSSLMKMFSPPLPGDVLVNFYINLSKLCLIVYQLHLLQPNSNKNFKPAGSSVLHNPGTMFEVNALKFEVSHVHKVECVVPWLNDTLVFFTISLQLCQQLKDKLLELQTFLTQSAHFQYPLCCGAMLLLFH
ncbi:UNVERIFIED_CONTAM: hypothetical protein FKN15_047496 [Acipenser sinensis]